MGGRGANNRMYLFFFVDKYNGFVTGGTYKWGGGGLITADVLFSLQVHGPVTQWGRFLVGKGRGHS